MCLPLKTEQELQAILAEQAKESDSEESDSEFEIWRKKRRLQRRPDRGGGEPLQSTYFLTEKVGV